MLGGDVAVFLDSGYLRNNQKLKGVVIFSDNLLPESSQLFWYDFPTTKKPSNWFLRLLSGK